MEKSADGQCMTVPAAATGFRSPAVIATGTRLSSGGMGQANWYENAHGGRTARFQSSSTSAARRRS